MQPDIDRGRLSADVRQWLADSKLTTRSASTRYPGLNPAMVSRACNMQVLSAASFLVVCQVMRKDPHIYLTFRDRLQRNQYVTAIVPRETRGAP
jgi:hypothetical protein